MIGPVTTKSDIEKLNALRIAMRDLSGVINEENSGTAMRWSRESFAGLGHDRFNPVPLALFALGWKDEFIAATKAVKEYRFKMEVRSSKAAADSSEPSTAMLSKGKNRPALRRLVEMLLDYAKNLVEGTDPRGEWD